MQVRIGARGSFIGGWLDDWLFFLGQGERSCIDRRRGRGGAGRMGAAGRGGVNGIQLSRPIAMYVVSWAVLECAVDVVVSIAAGMWFRRYPSSSMFGSF